jgi:hypothetical protein
MTTKEPRYAPKMANLVHRVALCTMLDVVSNDGYMELTRRPVAWLWAGIRQPRPSYLAPSGYAIMEEADRVTHIITIRAKTEVHVSAAAWVYEEFLKSPPRWYKVIGFVDIDHFIRLHCRLYERSDEVRQPAHLLSAAPQDVSL